MLNFVGAFLSLAVAATIASGIVQADLITPAIVFAGLIGAIAWNLATWYFGLPSSSSHALIGGVVGSAFVAEGPDAVLGAGIIEKVVVPGLVAPVLALVVTAIAISLAYRIVGRRRPGPVTRGFRLGQIVSGSLFSLSHGTNDAQKTMGIIFLTLIANGNLTVTDEVPTWVVVSSATAIALGTYVGGWRIIKTMGSRIIKMDPAQGFTAQTRRRHGDPVRVARGLPAVHDAGDLGLDHGRRRRQAAVGRALGRRGQHRHRVGADAARVRRGRRRSPTRSSRSSAPTTRARSSSPACCWWHWAWPSPAASRRAGR